MKEKSGGNDDGAGLRDVSRVLEDEEDIFDVMSKLLASKSSKHALSDPIIAPWVLSLTARMDTQLNFDLAEESVHRSQNTRDKCLNEGPRLGVTLARGRVK